MSKPKGIVQSNEAVELFNKIVSKAYGDVTGIITEKDLTKKWQRERLMRQIKQIVAEADADLKAWIRIEIPAFYEMGMFEATREIFNYAGDVNFGVAFASFHKEAVEVLSKETYQSIASGMSGLTRTGERMIATATRDALLKEVMVGKITGESAREISKQIEKKLRREGITALTDRGGRKWDLKNYSNMLSRTKLTQSSNSGVVNRMTDGGYDLVKVSSHSDSSSLCRPWQGRIYSVSGVSKEYPHLQTAIDGGLFHPNCLTGSNKVMTSKGALPISEIRNGSSVIDMFGVPTEVIVNVKTNYNGVIYSVKSGDFKMTGTPDHACFTQNGWTTFENLRVGDYLLQTHKDITFSKFKGVIFNSKDKETFINEEFISSSILDDLVCVGFSVYLDDSMTDYKITNISPNRFLERKNHTGTFKPFLDSRFELVGISKKSISQFFSTLFPNINPISVSPIFDKMFNRTLSWNSNLLHNLFDRCGGFITTDSGDILNTHVFFVIDPDQKLFDIANLLLNIFIGNTRHIDKINSKKRVCPVYDLQTAGTYILTNNVISHNCRHRMNPYHAEFLKDTTVWDNQQQKYVKFEELNKKQQVNKLK